MLQKKIRQIEETNHLPRIKIIALTANALDNEKVVLTLELIYSFAKPITAKN